MAKQIFKINFSIIESFWNSDNIIDSELCHKNETAKIII